MVDPIVVGAVVSAVAGTVSTAVGGLLVYSLRQIHQDARDVLETVESNRQRSEQNSEALAYLLRTRESIDVSTDDLADEISK
jgi:hypothetical protein